MCRIGSGVIRSRGTVERDSRTLIALKGSTDRSSPACALYLWSTSSRIWTSLGAAIHGCRSGRRCSASRYIRRTCSGLHALWTFGVRWRRGEALECGVRALGRGEAVFSAITPAISHG